MYAIETVSVHYRDVTMNAMASQITGVSIVYSTFFAQVKENIKAYRWPVNSPHKRPATQKLFPFYDVIMSFLIVFLHFYESAS